MTRTRLVIALVVAGATRALAAAQGLDAPLRQGATVHALDVDRPCNISRTVEGIARATGIRVGIEQPAGCVPGGRAKTPLGGMPMAGRSARELLDELVLRRTDYAWREVDGVSVVLPTTTWTDPNHLLRRAVPTTAVADLHPHLALHALLDAGGLLQPHEDVRLASAPDRPGEGPIEPISLTFAGGTLLSALNAVAARIGGHWEIGYAGSVPHVTMMGPRWEDSLFTVPLLAPRAGDPE